MINVIHDILALPATILVPFLEMSAVKSSQLKAFLAELANWPDDGNPLAVPVPEDQSAAACRARAVSRGCAGEGKGAALRALLSCGIANEHPLAELIMREMHPAPRRPVTAPQDLGPALRLPQ